MRRFEYLTGRIWVVCVDSVTNIEVVLGPDETKNLTELGKDGWELIKIAKWHVATADNHSLTEYDGIAIFKREQPLLNVMAQMEAEALARGIAAQAKGEL